MLARGVLCVLGRVVDALQAETGARDVVSVTMGIRWVDEKGNNRYFPKGVENSIDNPFVQRDVTFAVQDGRRLVSVEIGLRRYEGVCSEDAYECTKATRAWTLKSVEFKDVSLGFMRGTKRVVCATYACSAAGGPECSIQVNNENDP